MTGTLVNCAAVIIGGLIGLLLKKGIKESYTVGINKSLGLAVLVIGINGVIANMFTAQNGKLSSSGELLLIVFLVVGTLIGELLKLDELSSSVAIIKNVMSSKTGKKDIIKIDSDIKIDMDILGYVDPGITINIIKDGKVFKKEKIGLPETLTNVIKCKNPRCITSVENEIDHIFRLSDKENRIYRCIYCETKAE